MNEEALFALALEKKTAAERQALLDQACAGNAQLRAAVDGLLKASADAGSFLEHPPLPLDATIVSSAVSRDTAGADGWTARLSFLKPCDQPNRIGKLISKAGEYEIIEVVGHGGMGAVLRAFDTKLSRVVAVKVMAPELAANPVAVKRFLREATTAAAVHHEHVVTIHAVDDSHQPPYLVMQFVEGQTLQDKIDREGALELKHILRIGSQAAAGLAAAHKTGLIHRDVKPSNILLENGVERVKISDFGLARAADDVQMTQTGIISGTPQYMSPEQAKGEPIDAKSDLFSLGSVLYSMCTGRPAFRADNPIAVLRRVIDDTPRPIHEINAEIPSWLEAIVNKLLAKSPAERFQSAAEVADLLGQHLAHVQSPAQFPAPAQVEPPPRKPALPSPAASAWPPPLWLWSTGLFLAVTGMLVFFLRVAFSLQAPIIVAAVAGLGFLWVTAMACWSFAVAFQQARIGAASVSSVALLAGGLSLAVVVMFFGFLKIAFGYDTRPIAPIFVGLMLALVVAMAAWFASTLLSRPPASQHKITDAKPRKFIGRGLFIEHPVLGVVAILLLLISGGTATYLIMEALGRKNRLELAAEFDEERIQGTWFAVSGERNGGQSLSTDQLAQMQMIFKGNRVEARVPKGQSGGEGTFELGTAASPKRLKITRPEGPNRFAVMDGIYELNGNHLRICMGAPEERATEFKTLAGSRLMLVDFERPAASPNTIILPSLPKPDPAFGSPSSIYNANIPGLTWASLFNGKDLTGWKPHPETPGDWHVQNGVLIGRGPKPSYLYSEKGDFADFHLRAEARFNKGADTGIFFRASDQLFNRIPYAKQPAGYEAQIVDTSDPKRYAVGSVVDHGSAPPQLVKPDEWFTLEIIAVENRLLTKVNGVTTVDVADDKKTYKLGHIALQVWTPETVVEFRRIEIQELPPSATAGSSSSAAAPPEAHFVPLFNGRDLTGWTTHSNQPGNWKVENGELVGSEATSHLFSERGNYQDFHLRAEAMISDGGSSGVYFRAPEVAVGRYGEFPDGYEANINSTCKSDAARTGSLTGSLRGVARYRETTLHKPDEWFTLEVIARGPQIVIQVNGQTTVDFVDANNTFRRGHFALQVWPAQTVVRFRKISVRELLTAEEDQAAKPD